MRTLITNASVLYMVGDTAKNEKKNYREEIKLKKKLKIEEKKSKLFDQNSCENYINIIKKLLKN